MTASASLSLQEDEVVQLEQLCVSAVTISNQKDLDLESNEAREVLDHVATQWEARLDNFPFTLSLHDLLSAWREMDAQGTKLEANILHIGSRMHETNRTASVYMHLRMKRTKGGRGQDLSIYLFCELKWKFSNGKWICYSYTGMRKPCSDSGIVC